MKGLLRRLKISQTVHNITIAKKSWDGDNFDQCRNVINSERIFKIG